MCVSTPLSLSVLLLVSHPSLIYTSLLKEPHSLIWYCFCFSFFSSCNFWFCLWVYQSVTRKKEDSAVTASHKSKAKESIFYFDLILGDRNNTSYFSKTRNLLMQGYCKFFFLGQYSSILSFYIFLMHYWCSSYMHHSET